MLAHFIQKAHGRKFFVHPRIVVSVPSEITQVEKRAVTDSASRARASEVYLVDQAMMAAIGAGLPVMEPAGNMVVDIGGGTTDVAVISLAGVVYSKSVRVAGDEMDESIIRYIKQKYNLLIGERMAEQIKIQVGSACPLEQPILPYSSRPVYPERLLPELHSHRLPEQPVRPGCLYMTHRGVAGLRER